MWPALDRPEAKTVLERCAPREQDSKPYAVLQSAGAIHGAAVRHLCWLTGGLLCRVSAVCPLSRVVRLEVLGGLDGTLPIGETRPRTYACCSFHIRALLFHGRAL
jgi:hypothetical protein